LLNLKQWGGIGKEEILRNINVKLILNQQSIANSFNDHFLTITKKQTEAKQIDKMSQLKTEHLYIMFYKIVGIHIPILNSGRHQLKTQKRL